MTGGCGLMAPWHALRRVLDLRGTWRALLRNDALDGPTTFRAWEAFVQEPASTHWRCPCSVFFAGQVRAATFKAIADQATLDGIKAAELEAAWRVQVASLRVIEERMTPDDFVAVADRMIDTWYEFKAQAVAEQRAAGRLEPLAGAPGREDA